MGKLVFSNRDDASSFQHSNVVHLVTCILIPSYSVVLGKMEFVPSMILKIEFTLRGFESWI